MLRRSFTVRCQAPVRGVPGTGNPVVTQCRSNHNRSLIVPLQPNGCQTIHSAMPGGRFLRGPKFTESQPSTRLTEPFDGGKYQNSLNRRLYQKFWNVEVRISPVEIKSASTGNSNFIFHILYIPNPKLENEFA